MADKPAFQNDSLIIDENSITAGDKKIYVSNLAGYIYNNALPRRIFCIVSFIIGCAGIYLYYQYYNILAVGLLSAVIAAASLAMFFNSQDTITIQSNASILQINYPLGLKDNIKEIQDALDKVKK
jgi:hypothetical protein